MVSRFNTYAGRRDWLQLFLDVECAVDVHYAQAGMFDEPAISHASTVQELPSIGVTWETQSILIATFLIQDRGCPFKVRPVPQRDGRTRYALDWLTVPDCVSVSPGGRCGDNTVLAGHIDLSPHAESARAIMKAVGRHIKSQWTRIGVHWVGPEAKDVFDRGGRLTQNLHASSEYDLARE